MFAVRRTENIIILDYDDTLMWTTDLSPKLKVNMKYLGMLDSVVEKLLKECSNHGKIYVVTNAGRGWLEDTSQKYLKNSSKLLDKCEIISARDRYEKRFPKKCQKWKNMAFEDIFENFPDDSHLNVISMGDSLFEVNAARAVMRKFPEAILKTIKFKSKPNCERLIRQLCMVLKELDEIIHSGHDKHYILKS